MSVCIRGCAFTKLGETLLGFDVGKLIVTAPASVQLGHEHAPIIFAPTLLTIFVSSLVIYVPAHFFPWRTGDAPHVADSFLITGHRGDSCHALFLKDDWPLGSWHGSVHISDVFLASLKNGSHVIKGLRVLFIK